MSQPDYRLCGDAQLAEESSEMVAQEGMSGHAKRGNSRVFIVHETIVRGEPSRHKPESGTALSHRGDAIAGQWDRQSNEYWGGNANGELLSHAANVA